MHARAAAALLVLLPAVAGCVGPSGIRPDAPGPADDEPSAVPSPPWALPDQGPPPVDPEERLTAEPASFDIDGDWALRSSGGCGACTPSRELEGDAQHHLTVLFEDHRLVRVEFNTAPGEGFRTHPAVAPEERLQRLFEGVPRAAGMEVTILRTYEARVVGLEASALVQELREGWVQPGPQRPCADCGNRWFELRTDEGLRQANLFGDLANPDPFGRFADQVAELESDAHLYGTRSGAGVPGPEAPDEGPIPGCEGSEDSERYQVLRDAAAYEEAWGLVCSEVGRGRFPFATPPTPAVDFARHHVVAAFSGWKGSGGHSVDLGTVATDPGGSSVEVVRTRPGPDCYVTANENHPGAFFVVPPRPEPVRFTFTDRVRDCV